ncbi:DASS family sodium-coupled anion symporter [bacterium]|nr:DASS family sodium-coupled anion symporter [bacterium]
MISSTTAARAGLVIGPILGLLAWWFLQGEVDPVAARTAGIAVLMATFWMTEALPLAATALIPLVAFPLLGVSKGGDVASSYANDIIYLFLGGFLVAIAMEQCDLHRRIALLILRRAGSRPGALIGGFLGATAFISMWISNTATAMMMVPIAMALLARIDELAESRAVRPFGVAMMLAIAYGASIGGVATLVGTPPNLVLAKQLHSAFPEAPPLGFTEWMIFGVPLALVLLAATWGWLTWSCRGQKLDLSGAEATIREQYEGLGPWKRDQVIVAMVFAALAILWITRVDVNTGSVTLPGWQRLLPVKDFATDGTVAIAAALVLFLIPTAAKSGGMLLAPKSISKVPWDIVLLFGGGFALADAFAKSGLSAWVGGQTEVLRGINPLVMMILISLLVTFLTELTSNTATAQILLPLFAANAVALGIDPRLLMIPVAVSCSMAFMLPVATPPNAIVFGSGRLQIGDMMRAGLFLNLVGAIVIPLLMWVLADMAFGIDINSMPKWAALK